MAPLRAEKVSAMKNYINNSAVILGLILCSATFSAALLPSAFAQPKVSDNVTLHPCRLNTDEPPKLAIETAQYLVEKVYKLLWPVSTKGYASAVNGLDILINESGNDLPCYDKAVVFQLRASYKTEIGDYRGALSDYETSLRDDALPVVLTKRIKRSMEELKQLDVDEAVATGITDAEAKLIRHVPVLLPLECQNRLSSKTNFVKVEFDVSPKGRVANVKVLKSTKLCLKGPAIATVVKWLYRPALKQGEAAWQRDLIADFDF